MKKMAVILLLCSAILFGCGANEPQTDNVSSQQSESSVVESSDDAQEGITVEEGSAFTYIVIPLSYFGEMNNEEIKNDVISKIPDAVGISIEGDKAKVGLKPSDYEKIKDNLDELFPS